MRLAIVAVSVGGALGAASWAFQYRANTLDLSSRPVVDALSAKNIRLRQIEDQEASRQIEVAKELASEANATAENERLERVKLEALIAPRRLTLDQQKRIGRVCPGISGKAIIVRSYQLDSEAFVLGDQISSALQGSGFNVTPQLGFVQSSGRPDVGVQVRGPVEESELTQCLAIALRTIGDLEVTVNGPRHRRDSLIGGGNLLLNQDETMLPAGPLPEGTPVTLMIGVKPSHLSRTR